MNTGTMDIGVVGMGVMGSNLAFNMADHGFQVAGWNRTPDFTEAAVKSGPPANFHPFYDLKEFIGALKKPRRVFLMIAAGDPVDWAIGEIAPLLEAGDIILDGGNSFYEDTRRRHDALKEKNICYFGVGVSGGEKGARLGPAIMPGGDRAAYDAVRPILEGIAARAGEEPCCTYIGEDGAGHYVKMVHNGIEYADMQLIAETYLILKHAGGLSNARIGEIFHAWNGGELRSYLIGITADIFAEVDEETGAALVDIIVDRAGQKGTGRWTSLEALARGVDLSMISAACNARVLSNLTEERAQAGTVMTAPEGVAVSVDENFIEAVRRSLYTAKIVAYAQGFSLYRAAKEAFGWSLDFGRIASIFRAGCIIQAEFLQRITDAYEKEPNLKNLIFDDFFLSSINANMGSLRRTVCLAVERGVPIPAFSAAMQYIDALRSGQLGANLIQAQRDYFGAHTFERVDKEGSFHHVWQEHYEK